jgi:DNA invertase Pin-like site-specific DNA recombinase
MKLKPIIGYARVSTEEQANTHALEQQISRLINTGVQKVYFDIESDREQDRDQFKKVLQLVIRQEISELRAIRWDRLARDAYLYLEVKKIFKISGVKLILLDQGEVDFNTASGELHSDLQVLFSVHESRMLQERVNRGLDYRRSRNAAWMPILLG